MRERLLRQQTLNPAGLNVVASFHVHNMLAAELAAKSVLSNLPKLRLNDLGGDKDWYFSTDGKPEIQQIVPQLCQAVSQYLSTEATLLSAAATPPKQYNSAYFVSTELNGKRYFTIVPSNGDSDIQEVKENNPSEVVSVKLPGGESPEKCQKSLESFCNHLEATYRDMKAFNGWYHSPGLDKQSAQEIVEAYTKTWGCSIM